MFSAKHSVMARKIAGIALLAIAVMAASAPAHYFTPQKSIGGANLIPVDRAMSAWKVYQSPKHDFTFQYPATESCREQPVEWSGVIHIACTSLWVNVYDNPQAESVEDYFLDEDACVISKSLCEYLMEKRPLKTLTLGETNVFQTEMMASGSMPAIVAILVPYHQHILEFSGRSIQSAEIVQQIVSTLQITGS